MMCHAYADVPTAAYLATVDIDMRFYTIKIVQKTNAFKSDKQNFDTNPQSLL